MNQPSSESRATSGRGVACVIVDTAPDGLTLRPVHGPCLLDRAAENLRSWAGGVRVVVAAVSEPSVQHARAGGHEVVRISPTVEPFEFADRARLALARAFAPADTMTAALVIDSGAAMLRHRHFDLAMHHLSRTGVRSVAAVREEMGRGWIADDAGAPHPAVPRDTPGARRLIESGALYAFAPDAWSAGPDPRSEPFVLLELTADDAMVVRAEPDLDAAAGLLRRDQHRSALDLLRDVALLLLDFDGVFTDNRVLVMQDGTEGVMCSRGDGMGLEMLRKSGMPIVVVSKEVNPVVGARCRKLKIECVQGIDDKLPEVRRLAERFALPRERIAYVGNDTNDLGPMGWVGVPIAVSDAHRDAARAAKLVLTNAGGHGALRELCELLLDARRGR